MNNITIDIVTAKFALKYLKEVIHSGPVLDVFEQAIKANENIVTPTIQDQVNELRGIVNLNCDKITHIINGQIMYSKTIDRLKDTISQLQSVIEGMKGK